ncbi:MAG: MFS transporter [Candidatus Lokiarchaeota archaeon]|nr:MFS transporter [Candidatus Lokiarchaeota archaeon]MBD3201635.1 MFS transporter [Candidatus Lokiarchaeota archaeon]
MSKIGALAEKKDEELKQFEPRSRGYMIFLVIFMGFVGNMDNYLSLVESYITADILAFYGIGTVDFAFWQGIFGAISFAVFFVAWFFDAFGRRKGILLLMGIMAIPTLFIGIYPDSFWLFITLYGIFIMATQSNAWQIPITEESPAKKRGLYGGLTFLIGLIPIYALFGDDIARAFGWQWAYGAMFFLFLILLIPLYFMKEPERWERSRAEDHGGSFLKIKDAIKLLTRKDALYVAISSIVYTLWTISFKIGTTWGGVFYRDFLEMPDETFSSILTVGGLLTMVGAGVGGLLLDKLGRIGTLVFGCVGSAIGYIFLGITTSQIFYWMIYFFMPVVLAWIMVYFGEIFPTKVRSTAVGITNTAARSSYVTGPLIASGLLLLFPDWTGFWIVPGLIILIPMLSLLIKPYETKGQTLEEIEQNR